MLWRLFAPRPLKKARRAMHPSWVLEDAIVRSVRGGRRRRSRRRSAPWGWQGTGEAYTPDGRHVLFQCGHHHRTQAAMLECVPTRQRQIERGTNLHLVTKVLDTPESRQRAAEREAQKARRQQERSAQRQAHRERQEAAWQGRRQRSAADREAVRQVARRPMGWPGWGILAAAAAFLVSFVLAGIGGTGSPPADAAGALGLASIGAAAVCVPVALWRKIQARKRARAGLPEP